MKDTSKWFIYETENGAKFGCFRIKPITDIQFIERVERLKSHYGEDINLESSLVYIDAVGRFLIQDWENIGFIIDGEISDTEIPYTPENAFIMLSSGDLSNQLLDWILEKSMSISFVDGGLI